MGSPARIFAIVTLAVSLPWGILANERPCDEPTVVHEGREAPCTGVALGPEAYGRIHNGLEKLLLANSDLGMKMEVLSVEYQRMANLLEIERDAHARTRSLLDEPIQIPAAVPWYERPAFLVPVGIAVGAAITYLTVRLVE
uniref:Uncharacterized protein n=1 Tax=viral metagenome TaxID=1070528 RepID=A0A6M3L7G2_9ZZZZ